MAIFIAVAKREGVEGFSISFPDFPACAVAGATLDEVMAKARYALLAHIEALLAAGQQIGAPRTAESIDAAGALLLTAFEVPDDVGVARTEVQLPALTLARIEAFASRQGLSLSALLVEAVSRWAFRDGGTGDRQSLKSESPMLFDFTQPRELKVEPSSNLDNLPVRQDSPARMEEVTSIDDITIEMARLLDRQAVGEKRLKDDSQN